MEYTFKILHGLKVTLDNKVHKDNYLSLNNRDSPILCYLNKPHVKRNNQKKSKSRYYLWNSTMPRWYT